MRRKIRCCMSAPLMKRSGGGASSAFTSSRRTGSRRSTRAIGRACARPALAKQTRGDYDEEYRIVRPDGSVRWIRDRAFPVREVDGRVVARGGRGRGHHGAQTRGAKARAPDPDVCGSERHQRDHRAGGRSRPSVPGMRRIVVEEGRFALANVRLVDPLEQRMKPAATAAANHAGSGGPANGLPEPG